MAIAYSILEHIRMQVVIASSEAVPFAKTGGLADVCGALPLELARLEITPYLIMPCYPQVYQSGIPIEQTGITLEIPIGNKLVTGKLLLGHLPIPPLADQASFNGSDEPPGDVPVYFIEQADYFGRKGLYQEAGEDYRDNCERFVFFSRAVLEALRKLRIPVDVLHCNDWQTGLIPALLQIEYRGVPGLERAVSLMTVHNLAYQGAFWHWDMVLTGLDWKYFNWQQMEFYGNLNLLKTGLVFADAISTVSPTYAREIQTSAQGCGLEGVLQNRRENLFGILNGIDESVWNPATDRHLTTRYTVTNFEAGKAANKAALQRELGLPTEPRVPLAAFVGRLADQKGVDLLLELLRLWLPHREMQWVFLGTGDARAQEQLRQLAGEYPHKLAVRLEFSDPLAHRIEAAADIFLMPSRFEPCGLSQLYSLKYGTVPVVRSTGGLLDTITDTTAATLLDQTATGYQFGDYHSLALASALDRALGHYAQPEIWRQIVTTGMRQDWSWGRSAREYQQLYRRLCSRAQSRLQLQ
ncbi:MAG: glycogen synthase GlgA [Pirellulales bacterium]|nr:glycogen synthase GlgA [Pirellulales bacterium]